jgi:hypothetical protein
MDTGRIKRGNKKKIHWLHLLANIMALAGVLAELWLLR